MLTRKYRRTAEGWRLWDGRVDKLARKLRSVNPLTGKGVSRPGLLRYVRDALSPSQARRAKTMHAIQFGHSGIDSVPHVVSTVTGQPRTARMSCSTAATAKTTAARSA